MAIALFYGIVAKVCHHFRYLLLPSATFLYLPLPTSLPICRLAFPLSPITRPAGCRLAGNHLPPGFSRFFPDRCPSGYCRRKTFRISLHFLPFSVRQVSGQYIIVGPYAETATRTHALALARMHTRKHPPDTHAHTRTHIHTRAHTRTSTT